VPRAKQRVRGALRVAAVPSRAASSTSSKHVGIVGSTARSVQRGGGARFVAGTESASAWRHCFFAYAALLRVALRVVRIGPVRRRGTNCVPVAGGALGRRSAKPASSSAGFDRGPQPSTSGFAARRPKAQHPHQAGIRTRREHRHYAGRAKYAFAMSLMSLRRGEGGGS
jgi:hypothetical protein